MGTSMAPTYVNIFMVYLERKIIDQVDKKPDIWWRYIDHIFTIWTYSDESLIEFITQINNQHPKLQFTAEWYNRCIVFLDALVTLDEGRYEWP